MVVYLRIYQVKNIIITSIIQKVLFFVNYILLLIYYTYHLRVYYVKNVVNYNL